MPYVVDPKTGSRYWVDGASDVAAALAEGYTLEGAGDETTPLVTAGGREVAVPLGKLDEYSGAHPMAAELNPEENLQRGYEAFQAKELEDQYGGVGGDIRAGVEGALSGLTLGGYDVLADAAGMDTEKYAQANPNWRTAGEVSGVVGGALAGGGVEALSLLKATPAALASRGTLAAGRKLAGEGLAGRMVGTALEGGAYAAAQTTSQILIDDDPLVAEAAVAEVARNALFGAVLGGGTTGVFEGLGKVGNRLVRGLDDANPALNPRGVQGRKFADTVGKVVTDVDQSVEHALTQAERTAGMASKLSPEEAGTFTQWDTDLRGYADAVDAHVQDLAKVSIQPPRGIGEFNERLTQVHEDLQYILGPAGRAGPHGLALDEAGDRLFKALAKGEPEAILAAMPGYIRQVKRIGRMSEAVNFNEELEAILAFEARLKEPAKVGLADDLEELYTRFKTTRAGFEDSGGLAPAAVERNILESTEAGSRASVDGVGRFAASTHELAEAAGFVNHPMHGRVLGELGPMLEGVRIPREVVDPADIANLRAAQARMRKTLGVADGEPALLTKHVLNLVDEDVATLAPKLRDIDAYFKQAREFSGATKDDLLAARLDRLDGDIQMAARDALNGANLDRMSKEALGMILGAEILQFSGLDGPMDDILQLAALHKLLKAGAGKTRAVRSRGGFMKHVSRRIGGSVAQRAATQAGAGGAGLAGAVASVGAKTAGYSAGGWLHDALRGQAGFAGLAGQVRGRIGSLLEDVGRAGKAVGRPGSLSVAWMARTRFDFGSDNGPPRVQHGSTENRAGLRASFKARTSELARIAANPVAAQAKIHEQVRPLRLMSENLADQVEMHSLDIPLWLHEKAPKDPGTIQTLGVSGWEPSEVEILEFAEHGKGALYPMETIEGAFNGDISPQAAESLRTLWPEHFRTLQNEILKRAPELAASLSYPQMTRLSILCDVPIDSTLEPEFQQFMLDQEAMHLAEAEASMAKPASSSSSSSSPEADNEFSPSQKLQAPRS